MAWASQHGSVKRLRLDVQMAMGTSAATEKPVELGERRRLMALFVVAIGLATLIAPLIGTDPPVMGHSWWSPLMVVEEIRAGGLPVGAVSGDTSGSELMGRYADLVLYVFVLGYGMLAVSFLALALAPSIRLIRWAAGLCMVGTGADALFGHMSYQSALYAAGDGPPVHAGTLTLALLAVTALLFLICGLHELD